MAVKCGIGFKEKCLINGRKRFWLLNESLERTASKTIIKRTDDINWTFFNLLKARYAGIIAWYVLACLIQIKMGKGYCDATTKAVLDWEVWSANLPCIKFTNLASVRWMAAAKELKRCKQKERTQSSNACVRIQNYVIVTWAFVSNSKNSLWGYFRVKTWLNYYVFLILL